MGKTNHAAATIRYCPDCRATHGVQLAVEQVWRAHNVDDGAGRARDIEEGSAVVDFAQVVDDDAILAGFIRGDGDRTFSGGG